MMPNYIVLNKSNSCFWTIKVYVDSNSLILDIVFNTLKTFKNSKKYMGDIGEFVPMRQLDTFLRPTMRHISIR